MSKGAKKGIKNPFCPKPARMYRYMLVVYRYILATAPFCVTCIGTLVPIWHFFFLSPFFSYIFFQIGSSSADVKSILVDCLPSRVSLHAHLSFCSYSTQTDCIHGVGHCISFFGHFQSFHGVHYISSDQGS